MRPDEKDKDQGERIPQEPNYDYKKIVEEYEKWLEPIEDDNQFKVTFLAVKRKYMLLK